MEEAIKILTELGSSSVQRAIQEYTKWYFVYAIGWFILGCILICGGILFSRIKSDETEEWNVLIRWVVLGGLVFIGAAMIIFNLPTILSPEAYAIHQLIMDAVPK